MEIVNFTQHTSCIHFDKNEQPQIQWVQIDKDTRHTWQPCRNEVIFFLEGRMQLQLPGCAQYEGIKGKILFLPAAETYTYLALTPTILLIFRLSEAIQLCDSFHIETLHKVRRTDGQNDYTPRTREIGTLEISPRIWTFLDGIIGCLKDGIRCRIFFEMKIKEFFMMVRWYYPPEEIHDFLYAILSEDTAFSEYVRLQWTNYSNVTRLAASMNLTTRQFSKKFARVFGTTPYQWIKQGKTRIIHQQLTTTDKPYKYLAEEYGFKSAQQFSKFVKKHMGQTPGQIRMASMRKGKN